MSQRSEVKRKILAGAMFKLLYSIFLNRTKGPRLGYFLASLDREFVIERVRHFAQ